MCLYLMATYAPRLLNLLSHRALLMLNAHLVIIFHDISSFSYLLFLIPLSTRRTSVPVPISIAIVVGGGVDLRNHLSWLVVFS